ncbi:uncharacterized protein LOC143981579 [Lithobates pipiens]
MENSFGNITDYFERNLGIPKEDFLVFAGGVLLIIFNTLTLIAISLFRKRPLVKRFIEAVSERVKPLFKKLREEDEEEYKQKEIVFACIVLIILFTFLVICLLCFCCCCRGKDDKSSESAGEEIEMPIPREEEEAV